MGLNSEHTIDDRFNNLIDNTISQWFVKVTKIKRKGLGWHFVVNNNLLTPWPFEGREQCDQTLELKVAQFSQK